MPFELGPQQLIQNSYSTFPLSEGVDLLIFKLWSELPLHITISWKIGPTGLNGFSPMVTEVVYMTLLINHITQN